MHIDPTGSAYVVIDRSVVEGLQIYFPGGKEKKPFLTASNFGVPEITEVETIVGPDGNKFVASDDQGYHLFDEKGNISALPTEELITMEHFYTEVFGPLGQVININNTGSSFRSPSPDPLQRPDQPGIYKHPKFDLIIDNRDPTNIRAIDIKSGKEFEHVTRDIVHYGKEGLFFKDGDYLISSDPQDSTKRDAQGKIIKIQNAPAGVRILHHGIDYQLFNKDHLIPLNHIPLSFSSITFDGKYFVFTNPKTGDTLYLDPQTPDNPVFVSPHAYNKGILTTQTR